MVKLPKFNILSLAQFLNMVFISFTFDVFKLLRSKCVIALQPENILFISVTNDVSNLERLRVRTFTKPLNIFEQSVN